MSSVDGKVYFYQVCSAAKIHRASVFHIFFANEFFFGSNIIISGSNDSCDCASNGRDTKNEFVFFLLLQYIVYIIFSDDSALRLFSILLCVGMRA